ncbi:hypothetical protein B484DRAFT_481545 [Ochromonadaceae sp. CCMP2298]|nr:hypothetical protein B484DRAFT_481545 [Ochromonadaceae sp. CCMP2298]
MSARLKDDSWILSPKKASKTGNVHLVDEEQVLHCFGCSESFTLIIRKHNCRKCGNVVCGKCSSKYSLETETKERICSSCVTDSPVVRRNKPRGCRKLKLTFVVKSLTPKKCGEKRPFVLAEKIEAPAAAPAVRQTTPKRVKRVNKVQKVQPSKPDPKDYFNKMDREAEAEAHDENDDERTSLLPVSERKFIYDRDHDEDDEEEDEVTSRGVLCVLPPSLITFVFGNSDRKKLQ